LDSDASFLALCVPYALFHRLTIVLPSLDEAQATIQNSTAFVDYYCGVFMCVRPAIAPFMIMSCSGPNAALYVVGPASHVTIYAAVLSVYASRGNAHA